MKRFGIIPKALIAVGALTAPGLALALDLSYTTYDAFDEVVAGLQRLALVMSDPVYMVIIMSLVGITIAGSMFVFAGKVMGQSGNPATLFYSALVGLVIFTGTVVPKGTLYVYDPVRNQSQAVGSVPDIVVLLAGGLSLIETEFVRVVDTAGATPYGQDAGTIDYSLILAATRAPGITTNLEDSISQYMMDCGFTAIGSGHNGATKNELLRNTADLHDTFAKYSHPAWPTVFYGDGTDVGTPGTCADAWTYIDGKLGAGAPATLARMTDIICSEAGFNNSDAAQMARCNEEIVNASSLYGSAAGSSPTFLRNYVFASAITKMQNNPNFSVAQGQMVNRQMMAESFGSAEAMNQWVPKMRGFLTVIVLGIVPIALAFAATPLVYKALSLVSGLFLLLTIWGICDAISVVMARDAAVAAFSQIKQYQMGYEAIMNTPSAAVAALALFGKARMTALMLATVVSGGLFAIGSSALTSYASGMQKDFSEAGESAGKNTMLPDQNARIQQNNIDAPGQMSRMSQVGFDNAAGASAQGGARSGYSYRAQRDYVGDVGMNMNNVQEAGGQMDAGSSVGSIVGSKAVSDREGGGLTDTGARVQGINTQRGGVSTLEGQRAGQQIFGGDGVSDVATFKARQDAAGTGAQRDLALRFGSDGMDLNQIRPLEQQKTNEVGAALDASQADVGRDLHARTVGARERLSSAETLDGFAQGPERAGAADSTRRMAGTEAQEGVQDRHGYKGLLDGQTLQQERSASAGVAANELGGAEGAKKVGAVVGRQDAARDFGVASKNQQLASFFFGDSTSDLSKWHSASAGNFSAALEGKQAQRMADHLEGSGAITPRQADMLRKKGAFAVSGAMGESGNIASARFDGSFQSFQGSMANVNNGVVRETRDVDNNTFDRSDIVRDVNSNQFERSKSHVVSDTKSQVYADTATTDYTHSLRGAAAFTQDRGLVSDEIMKGYKGNTSNGAMDANSKNQITGQYVESLQAAGFKLGASSSEQFTSSVKAGGSVGVGTGSGSPATMNVSGGADASLLKNTQSATDRDAANSYYREALDRSVDEGRKAANTRPDLQGQEREKFIADYAANGMQDAHRDMLIRSGSQTNSAYNQNDVIQDTASDQRRQDANTPGKEDNRSLKEKFEDTNFGKAMEHYIGKY